MLTSLGPNTYFFLGKYTIFVLKNRRLLPQILPFCAENSVTESYFIQFGRRQCKRM